MGVTKSVAGETKSVAGVTKSDKERWIRGVTKGVVGTGTYCHYHHHKGRRERPFKIVVIGDGGVGKTTFIQHHLTKSEIQGVYFPKYTSTFAYFVSRIAFYTNKGPIPCNMWDTAGQEKFSGPGQRYYLDANAAIIMFDVTSRISYKNIPDWYRTIETVCGNIPMVLCGNKCDRPFRKVKTRMISYHRKKNLKYYDISAKSGYNCVEPILFILRKLARDDSLHFAPQPALVVSETQVNTATLSQMQTEMREMQACVFPDDDDGTL